MNRKGCFGPGEAAGANVPRTRGSCFLAEDRTKDHLFVKEEGK